MSITEQKSHVKHEAGMNACQLCVNPHNYRPIKPGVCSDLSWSLNFTHLQFKLASFDLKNTVSRSGDINDMNVSMCLDRLPNRCYLHDEVSSKKCTLPNDKKKSV